MYVDISRPDISKGSWCESCARKNNCYAVVSKPKCGRFMMDDSVHIQGNKWQIHWYCLCGHVEEEERDG